MKKLKYLLFALVTIMVSSFVYAKDSVEIKSIELDSKSTNAIVNSEPTFSGLTMNVDVSFRKVDDFVKYKVVVINNTDSEYELKEDASFNESNYISYKYETEDVLKAKEESIVYVTITYKNEISSDDLVDGKYNESNRSVIQLTETSSTVKNPYTSTYFSLLITLFVVCLVSLLLYAIIRNKKVVKYTTMSLLVLLVTPFVVKAIEELKLTMNVSVSIEQGFEVGYLNSDYGFYTDEELARYQTTSDTRCDVVYIGETKYNGCNYVIIKDEKVYTPGEEVTLKTQNIRYFITWDESTGENMCEEQSDDTWYCLESSERDDYTIETWDYDNLLNYYGFTYAPTDKEVMNFATYNFDYWDLDGYFSVNSPQIFTMPEHSVLFANRIISIA